MTRVYETMERPLVPVLAEMERNGVKVDRQRLSRLSGDFAQRMAALEAEIHALAGTPFNVGSPKQLGEVLFDRLGLGGGRKGKTGAYTTGADVLEELAAQGHDLPQRVLDWRLVAKLKSTYTDTLQDAINPDTGRVHTSYTIAGAATGRLASTDPNLQNIPVRTEEGRGIREAFIAEPGHVLVSLDYSQIELRILAHIADIPALKDAFARGLDIHAMTASEMFGVPIEGMPAHVRRQAKAINFGVIYGISAFGLANNLRIPREVAKKFIDTYFERFPGIREYMDRTHRLRQGARPRRDAVRAAHPHSRDQRPRPARRLRPAPGDQRPDPGLGRRHHPARDDPGAGGDPRPAGQDAAAGARRAAVRGRRGRGGRDRRRGAAGDGGRRDAGGGARRCRWWWTPARARPGRRRTESHHACSRVNRRRVAEAEPSCGLKLILADGAGVVSPPTRPRAPSRAGSGNGAG